MRVAGRANSESPTMDAPAPAAAQPQVQIESFDGPLGRRIIDTHIWAVREGLRGATAYDLFDGYCQRLVIHNVPLWRGHTAMETLHPQWSGYGHTWRRDLNAIQPEQYVRGSNIMDEHWQKSPMFDLIRRARAGEPNPLMRRHLELGPEQRDFEVLDEFFAAGATDYLAQLFIFGERGDPAHGTGIVYSFSTDRRGGFDADDTALMQATLPALSLAMKAHAGYVIASGLLQTYLGEETGRRVHAGAIERGSVESIHAVLWYADIRGFTAASDGMPGQAIIDLLDNVFETLTAALRSRGGEVLKFLGDGMLATLAFAGGRSRENLRARSRRGGGDDAGTCGVQRGARRRRPAGGGRRSRPARRRGALRQCRRSRPARLHGRGPGRQRSRAHRGALRAAGTRAAHLR